MSAADHSKDLSTLLKKLRDQHGEALAAQIEPCPSPIDPAEPLLGQFLKAFFLWESTSIKAAAAIKKLESAVVDFNELRHCLPDEIAKIVGERYPRIAERSLRLRTALNRIYLLEHAVTLEHLNTLGKREAREYLDALEGVPPFVSSRVCLLALSGHAAPVDSRIHRRLVEAKVITEAVSIHEAGSLLERKTRAGELPEAYMLLQAWADEGAFSAAESHLDGLRPIVKPAVDKAARDAAREAARARGESAKARVGGGGGGLRKKPERPLKGRRKS